MLGVSSDFLTNGTSDDLAESSLTDKELLNQFKAIEKMPERDKDVVKTLIDAFITKCNYTAVQNVPEKYRLPANRVDLAGGGIFH